jgi:RimJ/RimL family protein N-acetyltransferase
MLRSYILIYPRSDYCSAGFRYEGRIRKSVLREGNWLDELIFALADKDFREN